MAYPIPKLTPYPTPFTNHALLTEMRAYVVDGSCQHGGKLVKDRKRPQPLPGQTLVKMLRVGICNTDLEMLRGYTMGFTGFLDKPHHSTSPHAFATPSWHPLTPLTLFSHTCLAKHTM